MRHGGTIEEVSDDRFDGDMLHSVVLPLMADRRIAMCGGVDPYEIHKTETYLTTAGTRQSFAFKKMWEILVSMVRGESAFVLGSSFELPCMHDQLDLNFIIEQKESPNFNPLSFQREYESVWTGSSSDSLVSLDDLNKCRVLEVAETKAMDKDAEYILAYDAARAEGAANAQCALVVLKIKDRGDGTYTKHLVNIYSFEGTHFLEQALFLKEKVNEYKAAVLLVDTNGMGVGLVDFLVTDIDSNPVYSVTNDDRYDKYKTPNSIPMIYAISSVRKETKSSDIHNNFTSNISNQKIKLLKSEAYVKSKLFKNKRIDTDKYVELSQPFIMTDLLCDEIMNLEYKQSGNETQVKSISKGIGKDKFSALEYGLYWIYLKEKKNKIRRETVNVNISEIFKVFKQPVIRR